MTRERPLYATTQLFGLALMATAMTVVTILTIFVFDTEDSFWPLAAIAVVVTLVVWRFDGVWAKTLGLLGTLAIGGSAFFFALGLFHPFSPIEFIVGLLVVVGFFASLVAGIMTLAVGRRRDPGPTPRGRRFRKVVLGVMGVASVVSVVGFLLTRTTVAEAEAQGAATVDMTNFEFHPGATSMASDQGLMLVNKDPFAHDFTLDELDIQVDVRPGSEAIVDLSSLPPGTYHYFCSLHTDPATGEGMTGELTIEG